MTLDEIEKAFRRGCCSETRLAKEGCDVCGPVRIPIAEEMSFQFTCSVTKCTLTSDYLYLVLRVPDRDTNQPVDLEFTMQLPYEWASDNRWTPSARRRWIRMAVMTAIEHEVDEGFQVNGVRIYDPHQDGRGQHE